MFATNDLARAQEAANVMDYYQNLVRDVQVNLQKAVGPIRDTGQSVGFTKKLEDFVKELDKEIEGFGDPTELGLKGEVADKANAIMESKHPSRSQIAAQAPAKTDAQQEATTQSAKDKEEKKTQPTGGSK